MKGRFTRKPLLVAAVITLWLMLMGCAVVAVMRMQDLKIGDQKATKYVMSDDKTQLQEETVSQQVLTLSGLKGSANYQAAQDWFQFMREYDPNGEKLAALQGTIPPFPEKYDAYGVYTQEMTGKLDEITAKYGLKLAGPRVKAESAAHLLKYLGMEDVLLPGVPASMEQLGGDYYAGGCLSIDFILRMAEGEDRWSYPSLVSYYYTPKDCFQYLLCALEDTGDWEQWNYTTKAGEDLLVLRSPSDWRSWVFCDREDASVALRMETIYEEYADDSVTQTHMTREQIGQILETVDFAKAPKVGDAALLGNPQAEMSEPKNDESMNFIGEPVTISAVTGMALDGSDVSGQVTITAFRLGKDTATMTTGEYGEVRDPKVVLKDGSAIILRTEYGTERECHYAAESPIPLDQVDHVLLIDGTKLYPVNP